MHSRCDFRSYRECSCGPNQCRVQNIGTTTKASAKERDARVSIFVTLQWSILAFAVVSLSFFFIGKPELDRLAKVNQEITAWQR